MENVFGYLESYQIAKKINKKDIIYQIAQRIPAVGIGVFIALFLFSSTLYPGGSQVDLESEGFDWINNYWCNLMNEKGMNGKQNPARPYAIVAMLVLCTSLTIFFIQFANTFIKKTLWSSIIKICSILSMTTASLMFTEYHDLMTLVASFFGLFVAFGIIKAIYRSKLTIFKVGGLFCVFLLAINNYIYYSEQFILALPLIQKITFVVVLAWIVGLNTEMSRQVQEEHNRLT